jgi:hypothetical protein
LPGDALTTTASQRPAVRPRWLLWLVAIAAPLQAAAGVAVVISRPAVSPLSSGALPGYRLPGPSTPLDLRAAATITVPLSVGIPGIGVDSSLVRLGLGSDGSLDVPGDFGVAGWWTGGSAPGDPGAAVVVGHVDSFKGRAVFYRLRELTPGQPIVVRRSDESTVTFVVEALRQYPKDELPIDAIYGPTSEPTLRLITCGGSFDRALGSYRDNVVVFARLASAPSAPAPAVRG